MHNLNKNSKGGQETPGPLIEVISLVKEGSVILLPIIRLISEVPSNVIIIINYRLLLLLNHAQGYLYPHQKAHLGLHQFLPVVVHVC